MRSCAPRGRGPRAASCPSSRAPPRAPVQLRPPSEQLPVLGLLELALHVVDRRLRVDVPLRVQRALDRLRDVAVERRDRARDAVGDLRLQDVREGERLLQVLVLVERRRGGEQAALERYRYLVSGLAQAR